MRRSILCHSQALLQSVPSPLSLVRRCSAVPEEGGTAAMAQAPLQPRVLSIQSHVVHGYVGGAIFHCRLATGIVAGKRDPYVAEH